MKTKSLILGLIIVLLLLIQVYCLFFRANNYEQYTEIDSSSSKYFFILQNEDNNITIHTLNNYQIGYMNESDLPIFQKITQLQPTSIDINKLQYKKQGQITTSLWNDVDILLFNGTREEMQKKVPNYKLIEYFPKDTYRIETLFPRSHFDVYSDSKTSTFLLNLSKKNPSFYIYQTEQIVEFDPKYAFVLSGKINGEYTQISFNEDIIIMNEQKIDNLEVRLGEKILIKDQEFNDVNGVYIVTETQPALILQKKHDIQKNQPICVNNDGTHYFEYTSKYSCEHPNNVHGTPKKEPLKWATVCQRDYECENLQEKMIGCNQNKCMNTNFYV